MCCQIAFDQNKLLIEQILKRIEDVIGMIEEDQINCEKWHKDVINGLNKISSPLLQK